MVKYNVKVIHILPVLYSSLYIIDSQAVTNTFHFVLQNGSFEDAKRSIWRAEMGRLGSPNDTFENRVNIFQYWFVVALLLRSHEDG